MNDIRHSWRGGDFRAALFLSKAHQILLSRKFSVTHENSYERLNGFAVREGLSSLVSFSVFGDRSRGTIDATTRQAARGLGGRGQKFCRCEILLDSKAHYNDK